MRTEGILLKVVNKHRDLACLVLQYTSWQWQTGWQNVKIVGNLLPYATCVVRNLDLFLKRRITEERLTSISRDLRKTLAEFRTNTPGFQVSQIIGQCKRPGRRVQSLPYLPDDDPCHLFETSSFLVNLAGKMLPGRDL